MTDRIKQAMEYLQMSPTAFADAIGIGRSNLTHIFSRRNQPSLDIAKKILKAFPEISTEWLIMGMGDMLREKKIASAQEEPASDPLSKENVPKSQTALFDDIEEDDDPELEPSVTETPDEDTPSIPVAEVETTKAVHAQSAKKRNVIKSSESNISPAPQKRNRLLNSQEDKKISKIIFFYDDQSFEIYMPS